MADFHGSIAKRTRSFSATRVDEMHQIINKYENEDYIPCENDRMIHQQQLYAIRMLEHDTQAHNQACLRLVSVIAKRLEPLMGWLTFNDMAITKIRVVHHSMYLETDQHRQSEYMTPDEVLERDDIWQQLAKLRERRVPRVLLQALHPRLGQDSSVLRAYQQDLFANDVMRVVFSMLNV